MAMASADAIEDDDWWLHGSDVDEGEDECSSTAKRKRTAADEGVVGIKKKKRKRHKADEITEETFIALHTLQRQRQEITDALQPATVKFRKADFLQYTDGNNENGEAPTLSQFARAVCPEWGVRMKGFQMRGSPIVLLLTAAATRAVQLRRDISEFSGGCVIGKLFGKHMKLAEQAAFLKSRCTPIAVATPARLQLLIQSGALNLSSLRIVLIDWYWRDKKLRNFSSVPEVWRDFVAMYLSHLHALVRTKQIKLALF